MTEYSRSTAEPHASPYAGLLPYREEQARYFCGRESEIEQLRALSRVSRITVFYGPSGAGKSSLVWAGLIPRLKKAALPSLEAPSPAMQRMLERIGNDSKFADAIPILCREWADDPWAELQRAVRQTLSDVKSDECVFPDAWLSYGAPEVITKYSRSDDIFRDEAPEPLRSSKQAPQPPALILILDQFEELFVQHPALARYTPAELLAEAGRFSNSGANDSSAPQPSAQQADQALLLAGALTALLNTADSRVNVVFSLREDCLSSLDVLAPVLPALFGNLMRLEKLDREGVRRAICQPVRICADETGGPYEVEPELVSALLDEPAVQESDVAMQRRAKANREELRYEAIFVQLVMQKLWEECVLRNSPNMGILTFRAYMRLKGAKGIRRQFVFGTLSRQLSLALLPVSERVGEKGGRSQALRLKGNRGKRVFAAASRRMMTRTQKFAWVASELAAELTESGNVGDVAPLEMVAVLRSLSLSRIIGEVALPTPMLLSQQDGHPSVYDGRFELTHDRLAEDIIDWRVHFEVTMRALEAKRSEKERRRKDELKQKEIYVDDLRRARMEAARKAARTATFVGLTSLAVGILGAVFILILMRRESALIDEAEGKVQVYLKAREEARMQAADVQQARDAANDRVKDVEEKNKGLAKRFDDLVAKTNTLEIQAKSLVSLGHMFEESLKPAGIKDPFIGRIVSTLDAFSKAATDLGIDLKDTNESFAEVKSLVNNFKWLQGKVQIWGGRDGLRGLGESLAIVQTWKEAATTGVFRAEPDRSKPPRASELDPKQHYIAARWDYQSTPREWLLRTKVRVKNLKTGMILEAQPVEWGPPTHTGDMMALSPGLASALGLKEGDEAACDVPLPP